MTDTTETKTQHIKNNAPRDDRDENIEISHEKHCWIKSEDIRRSCKVGDINEWAFREK